jgi:hypothetical protein
VNNSFENARKTINYKKPKSLDDFDGETPTDKEIENDFKRQSFMDKNDNKRTSIK